MNTRWPAVGACAALAVLALSVPATSESRPRPPRDQTAPTVPANLRITAATEDSISLAWSASTDNSGSIHHYVTCYSGFMIPGAYCIWGPPVPPAKTVTGLVPGKEFSFRVKAVDAAGNESALSSPVSGSDRARRDAANHARGAARDGDDAVERVARLEALER